MCALLNGAISTLSGPNYRKPPRFRYIVSLFISSYWVPIQTL